MQTILKNLPPVLCWRWMTNALSCPPLQNPAPMTASSFSRWSILMQAADTQYLKKLERLQAADAFPPVELPDIGRLDQALLDYAARRQLVVSVELLGSGYYDCRGLVRQAGPEYFLLDALTVYGEADGVRLVPLKNVTQIACDTSDEQIIARLIGKRV